ncbi:MAG TPA: beta-ketoacyl-ACP synthase III [Pseudonocardiaceae bacterium]|jgi:3-oxoacyl-[acyl-carrier-protein] synthase-3|nr:beta-ketoacyl-ACP synthase III [Pseudonocardiaceae bacterium]
MTATVVLGAGASLPPRVVGNEELSSSLDTSDEWIRTRTGIRTRRWVDHGVATSDLAVDAGARALRSAGLTEVDAVIVATTTPDRLCPATAPEVAARLGLIGVPAHDVAAVCTGFLYGLANAVGLIASRAARTVLLIAAETFSTIIDPADRGTAVIFGDGAGAVVLGAGEPGDLGEVGPCVLGSDGSQADLIEIPAGGSRQRSTGQPAAAADHYFRMRGREVFRLAVERMSSASDEAVRRLGIGYGDIDLFVPHQANQRISGAVAKRLELDQDKVLSNVETVGNTAAASIPILLAEASADGRLKAGQRLLLVAFGGGLTWGAATMLWPEITAETGFLAPAED